MVNLDPTIKIITSDVNSLKMLLKTETVRLDKGATLNFRACLQETHIKCKDTHNLILKIWKRISNKVDLRGKNITETKVVIS